MTILRSTYCLVGVLTALILLTLVAADIEQVDISSVRTESLDRTIERVAAASPGAVRAFPDDLSQWEREREDIRQALDRSLGVSRIYEEAPLDVRIFEPRKLPGDSTVRPLLFDAEPGMAVSALLFEPPAPPPLPAVILFAGHTGRGKASREYALLVAELLSRGIAVLAVDEIGGGERAFTGQQMPELLRFGVTPGGVQVRDGKRAIDLLSTVPTIDAHRIGAVGHSGGGFQTFYLAALDERIAAAVAIKYVSSYLGMIRSGIEHTLDNYLLYPLRTFEQRHVLAAIAPRPFMVISSRDDIFPAHEASLTVSEAAHIYGLYGAEENLVFHVFPGGHDLARDEMKAAADFLAHRLGGTVPAFEAMTLVNAVKKAMSLQVAIPQEKQGTLADIAARLRRRGMFSPLPITPETDADLSSLVVADRLDGGGMRRQEVAIGRSGRFLFRVEMLFSSADRITKALLLVNPSRRDRRVCEQEVREGCVCLLMRLRNGSTERPLWPRFDYEEYRSWGNALLAGYSLDFFKESDIVLAQRYLVERFALSPAAVTSLVPESLLTESKYRLYGALTAARDTPSAF